MSNASPAASAENPAAPADAQPAERTAKPKTRVGEVVSTSMTKTIVVRFVRRVPHPVFGKIVKRSKKFYGHDENEEAQVGDQVKIEETRPMSRLKRWKLVEVVRH